MARGFNPSRWLADFGQDLRYAARSLARNPAFAVASILTLALGIGANAAMFSVVNGIVLKPLPFREPERLVQLYGSSALVPSRDALNHLPEIRSESRSFDSLVAYDVGARYLRVGDGVERIMTVRADKDFFAMLGASPLTGRTFHPDDSANVVVVSEAFWRQRFDGNPSMVGGTLVLDGQPLTVIGVMPEAFQFPFAVRLSGAAPVTRTDLWTPWDIPLPPQARFGAVTGRLRPGVTIEAAGTEMALIAQRLERDFPDSNTGRGLYLEPLARVVIGSAVRRPLFVLFGAVIIVLILACTNVVNLSLVRTSLRSREVAVRSAIGASSVRLCRQFLTESFFLVLMGGMAGALIGWLGTRQLTTLISAGMPRVHQVRFDWQVFGFLLIICAGTALTLGLIPAFAVMRGDAQPALQQASSRATVSAAQRRVRNALVIAEIGLALMLAVGATMLVRELVRLRRADSGMVTANVITFHVGHRMNVTTDVGRFSAIVDQVSRLPGVAAAGFTQMLPLQNWGWTSNSSAFVRRGQPPPPTPVYPIELRYVTPGYFEALGIPIRGRAFTSADSSDAPRVILINEALARRSFGDADPIGVEMNRGTIVGVVANVKQVGLDRDPAPEIYFPMVQNWSQLSDLGMSLVVRSAGSPEALTNPVRTIVSQVDPTMAVFSVKTMDRVVADSLSAFTLFLWLMAAFALLAILLAVTGTYGVIASLTAARTREFAIRAALGADRRQVIWLVVRQGLTLTAFGVVLGLSGAVWLAPALDDLPVAVGRPDIFTTIPIAAFIAVVALVASLVPARRAGAVQPMTLLRDE